MLRAPTLVAALVVAAHGGAAHVSRTAPVARTLARRAGTAPVMTATAGDVSATIAPTIEPDVVDEAAMLARSTFPVKPDALIARAKYVLNEAKVGTADPAVLAESFEFCAPFIGPLPRDEYLAALESFKIEDAFSVRPQWHAFRVDPFQPNRVWFVSRVVAVHDGKKTGAFGEPTGKTLEFPPQSFSLIFDEASNVVEFTVGYPIDRRVGNTGGLGGAFGYFWGVGRPLPFPEAKPYRKSWQLRSLGLINRLAKFFKRG